MRSSELLLPLMCCFHEMQAVRVWDWGGFNQPEIDLTLSCVVAEVNSRTFSS